MRQAQCAILKTACLGVFYTLLLLNHIQPTMQGGSTVTSEDNVAKGSEN